jgi:hypothetical protein
MNADEGWGGGWDGGGVGDEVKGKGDECTRKEKVKWRGKAEGRGKMWRYFFILTTISACSSLSIMIQTTHRTGHITQQHTAQCTRHTAYIRHHIGHYEERSTSLSVHMFR